MIMGIQNRTVVSLLAVSLASIATADVVPGIASIGKLSSAHASNAFTERAAPSVPSLSVGSRTAAANAIYAAFAPVSRPSSLTLADSLPPVVAAVDAPRISPIVFTLQFGSQTGSGRPPSRFVNDDTPGTSSNSGTATSIVPLPPAVFGGLAGLAALAIGRSVSRRGRSA